MRDKRNLSSADKVMLSKTSHAELVSVTHLNGADMQMTQDDGVLKQVQHDIVYKVDFQQNPTS